MKNIRQLSTVLTLLSCLALAGCTGGGCAALDKGADPVVVRAEQTAEFAFDIFDAYTRMEYNNRGTLQEASPQFEQVANIVRTDGRHAIEELRIATKVYKSNRNEQNKATLQTYLAVVENLQRIVMEYLVAPKKAGVALPPPPRGITSPPSRGSVTNVSTNR